MWCNKGIIFCLLWGGVLFMRSNVIGRRSVVEAYLSSPKTYQERRSWLQSIRVFRRIFTLLFVLFHLSTCLAFIQNSDTSTWAHSTFAKSDVSIYNDDLFHFIILSFYHLSNLSNPQVISFRIHYLLSLFFL